VDRGSKATLPLTMPRRVFKSSAEDPARRPLGIALHGGLPRPLRRGGIASDTSPWGPAGPYCGSGCRAAGSSAASLAWILT